MVCGYIMNNLDLTFGIMFFSIGKGISKGWFVLESGNPFHWVEATRTWGSYNFYYCYFYLIFSECLFLETKSFLTSLKRLLSSILIIYLSPFLCYKLIRILVFYRFGSLISWCMFYLHPLYVVINLVIL